MTINHDTLADDSPPVRYVQELPDYAALVRLAGECPSGIEILRQCLDMARLLIQKNTAYGDSALNPLRILAKSDPMEQIRVRIDDKLSRLKRGKEAGEDVILDLTGYFLLLQVARRRLREEQQQ